MAGVSVRRSPTHPCRQPSHRELLSHLNPHTHREQHVIERVEQCHIIEANRSSCRVVTTVKRQNKASGIQFNTQRSPSKPSSKNTIIEPLGTNGSKVSSKVEAKRHAHKKEKEV